MISNTMFGHYYTALHDYCQQYGYPIPSSNWKQTQSEHTDSFARPRQHVENIPTIQKGRAVKTEFASRGEATLTKTVSHKTPIGLTGNGALPPPIPRPGQQSLSPPSLDFSSKPTRTVSNNSYSRPSPPPSVSSYHTATDYFNPPTSGGANRGPSQSSTPYLGGAPLSKAPSVASVASVAASIASKKKPPPPPPPKRKPSNINFDYVVAVYDFPGQDPGDLPFREGDKIRVTKRTDSDNDWWEGELRGRKGSFPANYCKNA
jgi:amphiphysin